jgi:hypothetical protein
MPPLLPAHAAWLASVLSRDFWNSGAASGIGKTCLI